jgi:hypothetical protein
MLKKKSFNLYLVLTTLFLFFSVATSFAEDNDNGGNFHVTATSFSSSPNIDGKIEDPIWQESLVLESFTQYEPQEGSEPTEKTMVYIGYDSKNLYIAVRAFDSNPKAVRACLTKRDSVFGDDVITVYLDTFNDKKRAFVFQVNPCGVQVDGIYTETRRRGRGRGGGGGGGFFGFDRNFDTYFITEANMDEQGYTVEMAIPFKSLRFPNTPNQVWGLQIMRNIQRKNEEIYWHPRSRDVNGFLIQSGTLEVQGQIEKGKNFEIMPVLTGLKAMDSKADTDPGINLKYGITSDLTADLTVNPDFSQIEADMPQIDVNQRYALYYPEKRPFFMEGKDFFDTPFELVYTRNIVNPLLGAKLTGKVGKLTMGFMSAYDETPPEIDNPWEDDPDIEGYEGFVNVFRLKQDLYSESHLGFILTDKEMGPSWSSITGNYNRVAGFDGHFKFWNYYRLSFQVVGSQTKWGEDKTGVIPAMAFNFSRRARHLTFSLDYNHIPDDFEAALGFFRRKDIRSLRARVGYAFLPMNEYVVDIRPSLEYRRVYDFSDTLTDEEIQLGFMMTGWRNSFIYGGYSFELERYGGIDFHRKSFRSWIRSEPLAWLNASFNFSFGDSIYYDDDPYLGYKTSFGFTLTLKPLTNLRLFYTFRNDNFYENRGGERVYKVDIISQRISYQLNRHLSIRLITDYNNYHNDFYMSLLFSYELRPGTVFYFGIDDNQTQDDSGIYKVEGRFVFVKFSYWWRI